MSLRMIFQNSVVQLLKDRLKNFMRASEREREKEIEREFKLTLFKVKKEI